MCIRDSGLGAWFYDNGPTTTISSVSSTLTATPQVLYPTVVSDTQNWVRLTTTFVADSAYDNIVIGRFNPSAGLVTSNVSTGNYAYYYIDSVVVKLATGINNLYADSMICAGDTFQAVSYTHLDVYKRQVVDASMQPCCWQCYVGFACWHVLHTCCINNSALHVC